MGDVYPLHWRRSGGSRRYYESDQISAADRAYIPSGCERVWRKSWRFQPYDTGSADEFCIYRNRRPGNLYVAVSGDSGESVGRCNYHYIRVLFATVSSRMVGLVGSSNNPVSGMAIATLLISTMVLKATGTIGMPGMVAAISIGSIICIIAAIAGDTSQDLKNRIFSRFHTEKSADRRTDRRRCFRNYDRRRVISAECSMVLWYRTASGSAGYADEDGS